jgi:hypothetical protein
MDASNGNPVADRHALVMAVWLTAGLIGTALVHYGLARDLDIPIYAAGGVVLAAFIAHVITNAVYGTVFTRRELTLALVLYGLALIAFAMATLMVPQFKERFFLPLGLVLVVVGFGVLLYMVMHYGLRGVFDQFNIIRDAGVREAPERAQTRWRSRQ